MKKLEDLKSDLLADKIENFYVFFGEDYGIRKHYIDKIASYFTKVTPMDTCEDISAVTATKNIFNIKQLLFVYNDMEFAKKNENHIQTFINRLQNYTCILIYDEPFENTTLYKQFNQYITEFQAVQKNIAQEFVLSEVQLLDTDVEEMAYNCSNLYSNILLEADKVKNYASATDQTVQNAYEALYEKGQLIKKDDIFKCDEFMNSILVGDFKGAARWVPIVEGAPEKFYYSLTSIMNDFLIAGFIKQYGAGDGGSRAFNYKLFWGRIKTLKTMELPFEASYYFDSACRVAHIDKLVKGGKLNRDHIIDYFLTKVI